MMNVKNRKCIRQLSFKSLWASRKRNIIAIIAIALTTLLFTSLFTVVMSLNSSYETYQFRQIGGYSHGSFKDVTEEQAAAIAAHPKVKESGARTVIGIITEGVFAKTPAEVSYMDTNCTKWSYAQPTTGHMPESVKEIAMDTRSLELLGITPELGAEIQLTYTVSDKNQSGFDVTDTFILAGYWEYDNLMPVHYLNISKEYAAEIEARSVEAGLQPFRMDLNVMMASSINIRGQMEQVDTDLGYDWENYNNPNGVRIGVNWGYTSSQIASELDMGTIAAMLAFIVLVIFTGYLIIYNIFQISVVGDIRFYGLLKTIGVTPRQLGRIIRYQALLLCVIGIPIGTLLGYGVGVVLTPVVLKSSTLGTVSATMSRSPWIFIFSILFALVTVLLSCARPGRIAAKVSPVEATRYTEVLQTKKKSRSTRGAKVYQMAFANLGRNKSKTVLVVVSLTLSVVLLNSLYVFIDGFDMDKYLQAQTCADFIVSSTDYFRFNRAETYLSDETIADIQANTDQTTSGCGYTTIGFDQLWMKETAWRMEVNNYYPEELMEAALSSLEKRGDTVAVPTLIEGLDPALFDKLTVLEGDLAPLFQEDTHAIALSVSLDDYGNIQHPEYYPSIGDTITMTYAERIYYIDSRTGEYCDETTPDEYMRAVPINPHDVEYTVSALVSLPYSMSYRYSQIGYDVILPAETLKQDSGQDIVPMFYLFDTPDETAEAKAENYLADLTAGDFSPLMYESKATVRAEFEQFQQMFLLLGGVLCAVIGIVGILNFFNAIMTGILSRRREFAVLQSVGMTSRQLKSMLVYEGLFYALGSALTALILSVILNPLIGNLLESMFWFFSAHFTIVPVLIAVPVFALLGWLIPSIMYGQAAKHSVVERLRESE